jgi:transposase
MGEDKSEQLEFIPAQVKILEHVRYKYGCRHCEEGVKVAPLPAQPIPKSIATPGLLAHILISKYNDHIPLYRQEHILQRYQIDIARSTLCHWVLSCGELFQPLIDLIKQAIIRMYYLCVDETPVQVLEAVNKSSTSKSYMWVYLTGLLEHRLILYDYQPSRGSCVGAK